MHSDASFQFDVDDVKSQSELVFRVNGGVAAWKSPKQDTKEDSTMEVERVAASKVVRKAIWKKNYIQKSDIVPEITKPVVILCDNNRARESRSHTIQTHS
ncbi:UNVERIFIED_CONTAM: hypothetical protein Slati_3088200 [Sesamum latifolium]|uniref:Uncharacterized protein n=1 Tax=Sesamum latifolium TaxID=2727402 RepID=A0AAW2UUQ3_9LAMI